MRHVVPFLSILLVSAQALAAAPGPADQAMAGEMATMQHEMAAAPMTGDPDRDFVAMMLPHHEGAIAMAKSELQYGHSPYLRAMARRIIASQSRESTEMRAWLAKHPAP